MRNFFKLINKIDNVIMFAFILFAAVGVAQAANSAYNGDISKKELGVYSKDTAVTMFNDMTGYYKPIIEATGGMMADGASKMFNIASSCNPKSIGGGGPVYIKGGNSGGGFCDLAKKLPTIGGNKPIRY